METKALHRFTQRVAAYEDDLALAKLIVDKFIEEEVDGKKLSDIFNVEVSKYRVARHKNTKNGREIVGTHLRITLHVAFIKELYEDFSEYINTILTGAARVGVKPERFVGRAGIELTAVEVLQAGSWEALISNVSNKIFRSLENKRSTKELVQGMSDRIGLNIDKSIFEAAIPYLETRHILVHRDGRPDDQFRTNFPNVKIRKNGQILVNFDFITNAKKYICDLAEHIDAKVIENGLVKEYELRGAKVDTGI